MKRLALFAVQVYCFVSHRCKHVWGRTINLDLHVALYKDTVVRVCGVCGASKLYPR